MEDYIWILVIIGIAIIWGIISWIITTISNSKKYIELKPKLDNLERTIKEHELKIIKDATKIEAESKKKLDEFSQKTKKDEESLQKQKETFQLEVKSWNEEMQKNKEEIQKIASQKSMGFPWLAEAYADYFALKDGKLETYLKYKSHPAPTTAENVKIIKNEKRELLKENKIVRYKINYFEKLFP
jgi:putative NIF3 family GTP cyclohydrolase 1 type 2